MISSRGAAYSLSLSLLIVSIFVSAGAGENYKYESHGKRDPFVPLVGVDWPAVSKLEDVTSIADLNLEGIASSPKGSLVAILNGEIVKEGDRFGDIKINKITKKTVTIIMGDKSYNKEISEEGGAKNER